MPKTTPLQEAFSSGEISPKLLGRTSAKGYQTGVAIMENFVADSRGPAIRRNGSRFIKEFDGNDGRVFMLSINENTGYGIILTDSLLTPVALDGHSVSTNYVQNPRFRDGGLNWSVSSNRGSVSFAPDLCTLQVSSGGGGSGARYAQISQEITVPLAGDYRVTCADLSGNAYSVLVGTTEGAEDVARFEAPLGGPLSEPVTFPGLSLWVTVLNEGRGTEVYIPAVSVFDPTVESTIVAPWTEQQLPDVHIAIAPGGDIAYLMHPNVPTYKLIYVYDTDTLTLEEVTFTDPPLQWTNGSFPRTGVFHEGRFWLAGTPNEPQTFWGSKSNLYETFTLGDLADDGLVFTLAKLGDIRWMVSTKNLLIGTNLGEHIVTSVEGVLTPSDIQVTQQSAYGSNHIQALQIGDQIFYTSPDSVKIRAMQYEWTADNWLSNDITFFSDHITQAGVRHVAWAQNPNNLFVCVLEDGTIAGLTYERGEEIFGWHRHIYGGKVKDFTTGPLRGKDIQLMLNNRVDGKLYFEATPYLRDEYMDSWTEHVLDPPGQIVTGLEYLEGETVAVTTDGAVHPNCEVISGEISLDWDATFVVVGLPYTSTMKTLPFDKGAPGGGSGQSYMKRYNKIFVTLLDSAKPLINGERQPERYPQTPMNTREPDRTERTFVAELGYDRLAQVTIEQDLPLSCTVVSIAGEQIMESF